jgi:hypothetical protein
MVVSWTWLMTSRPDAWLADPDVTNALEADNDEVIGPRPSSPALSDERLGQLSQLPRWRRRLATRNTAVARQVYLWELQQDLKRNQMPHTPSNGPSPAWRQGTSPEG